MVDHYWFGDPILGLDMFVDAIVQELFTQRILDKALCEILNDIPKTPVSPHLVDTIQCGLNVVMSQGLMTYIYIRVSDILSADL